MTDLLHIGNRTFRPITAKPEPRQPTIRQRVEAQYGTQKAAAEAWGVGRKQVWYWCHGERKAPEWVREDLGIE